jgi:splicing factor 3A subunit 2
VSPVTFRTHLGTLECRLCLTLHVNEGSYLAHTQGKKHQTNLARRAARDNKESTLMIQAPSSAPQVRKKVFVKIGRPGEHGIPNSDHRGDRFGMEGLVANRS